MIKFPFTDNDLTLIARSLRTDAELYEAEVKKTNNQREKKELAGYAKNLRGLADHALNVRERLRKPGPPLCSGDAAVFLADLALRLSEARNAKRGD